MAKNSTRAGISEISLSFPFFDTVLVLVPIFGPVFGLIFVDVLVPGTLLYYNKPVSCVGFSHGAVFPRH